MISEEQGDKKYIISLADTSFRLVIVLLIINCHNEVLVGEKVSSSSQILDGLHVFPGGEVETGDIIATLETKLPPYIEAAFREGKEETGLEREDIEVKRIIGTSERRRRRTKTEFITTIWLEVSTVAGAEKKVQGGDDLRDLRWVPGSEALDSFHPKAFERMPGAVIEFLTRLKKDCCK